MWGQPPPPQQQYPPPQQPPYQQQQPPQYQQQPPPYQQQPPGGQPYQPVDQTPSQYQADPYGQQQPYGADPYGNPYGGAGDPYGNPYGSPPPPVPQGPPKSPISSFSISMVCRCCGLANLVYLLLLVQLIRGQTAQQTARDGIFMPTLFEISYYNYYQNGMLKFWFPAYPGLEHYVASKDLDPRTSARKGSNKGQRSVAFRQFTNPADLTGAQPVWRVPLDYLGWNYQKSMTERNEYWIKNLKAGDLADSLNVSFQIPFFIISSTLFLEIFVGLIATPFFLMAAFAEGKEKLENKPNFACTLYLAAHGMSALFQFVRLIVIFYMDIWFLIGFAVMFVLYIVTFAAAVGWALFNLTMAMRLKREMNWVEVKPMDAPDGQFPGGPMMMDGGDGSMMQPVGSSEMGIAPVGSGPMPVQ